MHFVSLWSNYKLKVHIKLVLLKNDSKNYKWVYVWAVYSYLLDGKLNGFKL